MTTIGPLDPAKAEIAVRTIVQAFHMDPALIHMLPDEAQRDKGMALFANASVTHYLRHCRIDSTPEADGVAQWRAPDSPEMDLGLMLQSGIFLMPFRMGLGTFLRMMRMNRYTEELHKEAAPGPHWYLANLAVAPHLQGQGIGSALMRAGLARADADGVPCYLETSHPRNLPFYERHGFQVVHAGALPEGGPPYWAMVREGN